jgi:hypothetical protein
MIPGAGCRQQVMVYLAAGRADDAGIRVHATAMTEHPALGPAVACPHGPARHDDQDDTGQHARAAIAAGHWNGMALLPSLPARHGTTVRGKIMMTAMLMQATHARTKHGRSNCGTRDYAGAPYHPIDSRHVRTVPAIALLEIARPALLAVLAPRGE